MNNAREFTSRLSELLRDERSALAEFLVALADFDRRRLWLELGYASLFDFLHRELGLSKASASFRKKAAELVQRFPEVAEPLRDGRLCLTSVFELGKVLTPENRDEVLPRFFQLSRREAKNVVAELRPQEPPSRTVIVTTVSPARSAATPVLCAPPSAPGDCGDPQDLISGNVVCPVKPLIVDAKPAREPLSLPRASSEPLDADLSRLHVTVSRRFLEKLEAAREALSHSHPGATEQEVLEAGLDRILQRQAKRRGLVAKPRGEPPPAKPGHVPAHVRRAVWERDGGRCQWPMADGGICGSTHRAELDHVLARGRGGPPKIENLRVLCGVHNDLWARQTYGDDWMDRFTRKGRVGGAERGRERGPRSRSGAARGRTGGRTHGDSRNRPSDARGLASDPGAAPPS